MRQALTALFALAACALPAHAQEEAFWTQAPIRGGCTLAVPTHFPPPAGTTYVWDGLCTPGAGVTGLGAVTMSFRGSDGADYTAATTGEWVAGYPNGRFLVRVRNAQGRVLRESQILYNMGCAADDPESACTPGTAE